MLKPYRPLTLASIRAFMVRGWLALMLPRRPLSSAATGPLSLYSPWNPWYTGMSTRYNADSAAPAATCFATIGEDKT